MVVLAIHIGNHIQAIKFGQPTIDLDVQTLLLYLQCKRYDPTGLDPSARFIQTDVEKEKTVPVLESNEHNKNQNNLNILSRPCGKPRKANQKNPKIARLP